MATQIRILLSGCVLEYTKDVFSMGKGLETFTFSNSKISQQQRLFLSSALWGAIGLQKAVFPRTFLVELEKVSQSF